MEPTALRTRLEEIIRTCVDQVVAALTDGFATFAAEARMPAVSPAPAATPKRRGRPPKSAAQPAPTRGRAAKPRAAKPAGRVRRSGESLQAAGDRILKLLSANKKGLRIEQINKELGAKPKELARPILKLLEDGKIKKTGQKRATTYLPA